MYIDADIYTTATAHRTLIVRHLKGLQDIIDYTVVHYQMTEHGWRFATSSEASPNKNVIEEPFYGATHLRDIYFKANPDYEGRYTVPVLWDKKTEQIVNNESSEVIRMLYTEFDDLIAEEYRGLEFLKGREKEVDELNKWIYDDVNNGV